MMEHWIEITPDEVGSGPFVIYFTTALAPPPQTPYQRHPPFNPHPLLPEFLPQQHIMVIRQYVCIGINQRKSPSQEL